MDRTEPTEKRVAPVVDPMLAQAIEALPGPDALARNAVEMKFDGYRAVLFTTARPGEPVLPTIDSRRAGSTRTTRP